MLAAADVLTLHSPLTDETRGLINRETIAKMKDGARLVNAARGGLVDEEALVEAIRSGKLAGAALDVFSHEPYDGPLLELDEVVVTPHLAASTDEAQDRAGVIIAEQVVAALDGGLVSNAVNIPVVDKADLEVLGPFIPLAAMLGRLAVELAGGFPRRIVVASHGPLSDYDTRLLTVAALNGAFQGRVDQVVNVVNAPVLAAERGIPVSEERFRGSRDYTNLVEVRVGVDGEEVDVSGTTIGPEPRLFLAGALGLRDRHRARRAPGVRPLRRPAGRDRTGRDAVRRRRRQHRQHGRVPHEGERQCPDGVLGRHEAVGERGRPAARRRASTTCIVIELGA